VSIVINKGLGFRVPTANLVSKMDTGIEEIFYRYVHNSDGSKPFPNERMGEIIFF
jgi:hypothetical protein